MSIYSKMRISNPSPYFETTEQVLYNLKNIILTTAAIITLSATSVFANEITFKQRNTDNVSNLAFEQASSGSANEIDLGISGGMTSVIIEQSGGEEGNTSSGNIGNVELYMNSHASQFDGFDGATREDGWKTFSATYDGDGNSFDFNLGTASDATQFADVDIDIAATGHINDLTHNVANGLDGDSLQIGGTVNGDSNIVLATLGAAGDIAFNYDIQGDSNTYTSTIAGPASGGRTVDIALTGESNVWTVTANASGGIMNVASYGSNVTGAHTQNGTGSELQMDINKSGSAAFAVTTTQTGPAYADVTVNAADGGAFRLTQTGSAASFIGAINLGAGGAATITQ
jgi:hypothetical protein